MLAEYQRRLEERLNADPELGRRLQGFKTFAGKPDGHHRRARAQGDAAIATAVRCYPFGGTSALDGHELVGFHIRDGGERARFVISLSGGKFTVRPGDWSQPLLALSLPKDLFKRTVLGRYRWLWVIGMDEVQVAHANELPHSDWVTIFEVLVVMQEIVEFDTDLLDMVAGL